MALASAGASCSITHLTISTRHCAHEQWPAAGRINGHGYDGQLFVTLVGCAERFEAHLSEYCTDFRPIRYTYELLRCIYAKDIAIIVMMTETTDNRQTDNTDCFTHWHMYMG